MNFLVSKNTVLMGMGGEVILYDRDQRVSIGFGNLSIFDQKYERTIWNNNGAISFFGSAHLGQGSRINNQGNLSFGKNFGISGNTTINCEDSVSFGDNCLVSWGVLIMDSDGHDILNENDEIINGPRPICIEDNVWVSCRCTILKGTFINHDCIIAAESRISGHVSQANAIYGNNGEILKTNIKWTF